MDTGIILGELANRQNLSRQYFPAGNEDMEHALMYPNPAIPPPAQSDRIFTDPYTSADQPKIINNLSDFIIDDHERLLVTSQTRQILGKDFEGYILKSYEL